MESREVKLSVSDDFKSHLITLHDNGLWNQANDVQPGSDYWKGSVETLAHLIYLLEQS